MCVFSMYWRGPFPSNVNAWFFTLVVIDSLPPCLTTRRFGGILRRDFSEGGMIVLKRNSGTLKRFKNTQKSCHYKCWGLFNFIVQYHSVVVWMFRTTFDVITLHHYNDTEMDFFADERKTMNHKMITNVLCITKNRPKGREKKTRGRICRGTLWTEPLC